MPTRLAGLFSMRESTNSSIHIQATIAEIGVDWDRVLQSVANRIMTQLGLELVQQRYSSRYEGGAERRTPGSGIEVPRIRGLNRLSGSCHCRHGTIVGEQALQVSRGSGG